MGGSIRVPIDNDVTRKDLKLYTAFKRIKNIACVSLVPNKDPRVVMWLKLNPDNVHLEKGFTKDVRNIGHWGTGDLEVEVRDAEQLERAKQLLLKSFEEA
jgi:predicted transport protein